MRNRDKQPATGRALLALVAQLALTAYFQALLWIPLGRWNEQPGFVPLATQAAQGRLQPGDVAAALAFALPFGFYLWAFVGKISWLKWACLVGYVVWLGLQIQTWWVAYILGAGDRWAATYQRVFSRSTQVLPSFGRHLPPDGMHFVLQLLLGAVVASLALELLPRRRASRGISAAASV